ncbi:MAG: hypothetical protein KDC38_03040 [Planctomycetes bacterium]|nr:hypothetical protein [Planctomycetota bacterium]
MLKTIVALGLLAGWAWTATANVPGGRAAAAARSRALVALTGPKCAVAERGYALATTEEQFVRLWQRYRGEKATGKYDAHYNEIGLPVVDFERCCVLTIFHGEGWNSAGLAVESIAELDDRVRFRYDDKSYQTEGPDGGGERCRVYGFFVLPRTSKQLVVEQNVQGLIGGEPVWKERATFPEAKR